MPDAIARVRQIIDSSTYLDDRPPELLSATLKKESATATARRNARNDERFAFYFCSAAKNLHKAST
jgi:hypothetical protein